MNFGPVPDRCQVMDKSPPCMSTGGHKNYAYKLNDGVKNIIKSPITQKDTIWE